MAQAPVGVIHGRFQPVHLEHLKYLLAGKERCEFLYVGITNPDPETTRDHPTNPERTQSGANPYTYRERMLMVRDALVKAGVPHSEFAVVPFPINRPELWEYYGPLDAVFYVTIYDDWGRAKVAMFRERGLEVEVMWERTLEERVMSGTEVRGLIRSGGDWQKLVPPAVAKHIEGRLI
jgi:cytidyltransferase-like protein